MNIFIARQPILDKNYKVFGYELLYRNNLNNYFSNDISHNAATSILLINSYVHFGIDNLVGEAKAFINFDKHLINYGVAKLLDKDKIIIEILEDVAPDDRLMKNILELKNMNYIIAHDDYTKNNRYSEITEVCNWIKVDFIENSKEEIIFIVNRFKNKSKVLLAEKVETKEEFEWAKNVGFKYFQGYYFARPSIMKKKNLPENALKYVQLMNELNEKYIDYKKITDIIVTDISLTYRLLKLVNSKTKYKDEVNSIHQALTIIGTREFRTWLSLAMVKDLSNYETNESVRLSMQRSNFLSKIAKTSSLSDYREELALIGTLSVIDTILEMDMEEALKNIPINTELKLTLLGKQTKYSDAFSLCLLYEKGNFDEAFKLAPLIEYDIENLSNAYFASVKWADNIYNQLTIKTL